MTSLQTDSMLRQPLAPTVTLLSQIMPLYVITTSRVHWKSKAWSVLRVLFLPLVISSRGCIKYILFHSTPRPPLNIHTITHRPQSQGIALAVACLPQSCLSFSPVDAPYVAKPKLVTKGKVSNCFLDPICLQPWSNHVYLPCAPKWWTLSTLSWNLTWYPPSLK